MVGAGTIAVQVRSPTMSYFLLVFVLHVFAWHCAGRARWCLGASFSVFLLIARFVFLHLVERALDA